MALRLQSAPGQEVAWVLYPRGAGEAAPVVTQLAPGVTKVVTAEGTDYVFLSTAPLTSAAKGRVRRPGRRGARAERRQGHAGPLPPGRARLVPAVMSSTAACPSRRRSPPATNTEILARPGCRTIKTPAALPVARHWQPA